MQTRRLGSLLGIAVAAFSIASPSFAQRGRGKGIRVPPISRHEAHLEVFERMSPEQRQQAMASLPPERRKKLQKQLDVYDHLSPAQKGQLDWFNHLPPDRQEAFRKVYKNFLNEPPGRQQILRDEMSRLSSLPKAERKARLSSPEVRSNFNKREQQILEQMSEALPHD